MLKILLILPSLLLAVSPVAAGGISVSQLLDSDSIAYEDSVSFEITLVWNGTQVAYRFDRPLSPQIDGLKIRGFTSSIASTGVGEDETTTKTFRYTLVPSSSGLGRIAPITIGYITWPDSIPGELVTEEMTVRIARPKPAEPGRSTGSLWLVISAIAVVVFIAGGLLAKRLRNKTGVEPVKSPVQQFLEDLSDVKKEAGNDLKKFQTGLCRILSEFLTTQYNLDPERLSDEELADALGALDLNEGVRSKISAYLLKAREDKFRPLTSAPGETIRLEAEIRETFEKMQSF